ncbi:MAG: exodeoxyribonuclease VII small subunit [Oscillospiraceae bacterium]|nr:exodeoxyribonuclease VII small subunit [Oscillospiraceae bacterium]
MSEASKSFEAGLRRLEEIVRKLESGDLPLEEALSLFEEGTALAKSGNALLDQAELKVARLMKGPDGAPVETEFEPHG